MVRLAMGLPAATLALAGWAFDATESLTISAQDLGAIVVRGDRSSVLPIESNNQTRLSSGTGLIDGYRLIDEAEGSKRANFAKKSREPASTVSVHRHSTKDSPKGQCTLSGVGIYDFSECIDH